MGCPRSKPRDNETLAVRMVRRETSQATSVKQLLNDGERPGCYRIGGNHNVKFGLLGSLEYDLYPVESPVE